VAIHRWREISITLKILLPGVLSQIARFQQLSLNPDAKGVEPMKLPILQRMFVVWLAIAFVLTTGNALCQSARSRFQVKDAAIAIKIAKAALEQEFGQKEVSKLKSLEATLEGEKWIVYAHHYKQLKLNQIPPSNGGSFDVEVAVDQGSILAVRVEM